MSITADRSKVYENMSPKEKDVVDEAFLAAYNLLKENGVRVANDDRAENLVGAIARYVRDSK